MSSGYRTQSQDTSFDAEQLQIRRFQQMSLTQKLALVDSLVRMADRLSRAGILLRYPGADDREIGLRAAALRLDAETMREVYDWDPDEKGL